MKKIGASAVKKAFRAIKGRFLGLSVKRRAAACGGAAAVLAIALLGLSGGKKVELIEARIMSVEDRYTEEGVISSGGEYQVAARVSGPVEEVFVEENDRVKAGDALFSIDAREYEYEKALGESALKELKAQAQLNDIGQVMTESPQEYLESIRRQAAASQASYEAARSVYEGDQVLYESGAISRIQMEADAAAYEAALASYQQAKSRYEESALYLESLREQGIDEGTINSRFYESEKNRLDAQIKAQETALEQIEERIGDCTVRAGADGIVTSLPVKEMSLIQSGETAAVIRDSREAGAEADVLTAIAPYIKEGDPVEAVLVLRGREETCRGTVRKVYGYASPDTSALGLLEYRVHVKVGLEGELLDKEGYGVELDFLLYQKDNCLTVPADAVFEADGEHFVYQKEHGRAVKRSVQVEYETGGLAVINGGLSEGDLVIGKADEEGIYEGARVR